LVQTITGREHAQELIVRARDNVPQNSAATKLMQRRISTKLALKLATRISARVPARLVMGFIPFAGAIVNAFFNAQTLRGMADSADKYYSNAFSADSLKA
jgi:hypothetical protein